MQRVVGQDEGRPCHVEEKEVEGGGRGGGNRATSSPTDRHLNRWIFLARHSIRCIIVQHIAEIWFGGSCSRSIRSILGTKAHFNYGYRRDGDTSENN